MEAILVDHLTKTFELDNELLVAVDNLSFSIQTGQIVALLGPNGAGKTTTVRMIASLYNPTSGTILVEGKNVLTQSIQVRSSIGIAHERPSFYKRLSGRRNLKFYADLYDVPKNQIDIRIDQLAREFDLEDAIDQPVGGYSKGMQQKLSVAKALIHYPQILIFDEPWSGLSPGATRDLRKKIQQLGEEGKTILITTHNLAQAEQVADHLVIISHGQLIAEGSPAVLRSKYHLNPELKIRLREALNDITIPLPFVTSVNQNKNELLVGLETFEYTPRLLKYLIEQDIAIQEVKENIPSLEDVYLGLVEEN